MAFSPPRPTPLPPGTRLSEHYTVEGLVRLAERRKYYLANDDRDDRPVRFCWECGNDETPRAAATCNACGEAMNTRRFLIATRWASDEFESFSRYFEKHFSHPALLAPVDMFFHEGMLCSVIPWSGETLMIDEGSPLPIEKLLNMAQRATGIMAFLHHNGVCLQRLNASHFLLRDGKEALLFDPEIATVYDGPVPEQIRRRDTTYLGYLLNLYTPASAPDLGDLFKQAVGGEMATPLQLGRNIEEALDSHENSEYSNGIAAMSDVGLCRLLNEDNWSWIQLAPKAYLYVVADGMGGHQAGEVASAMAVETICRVARERLSHAPTPTPDILENVLDEAFQTANNTIKDYSERMGNDMGTTLVATVVYDDSLALVANVGDSRGYLMRNKVLHQITRDHSLVARMVEQNRLTAEEARHHPHSNILLRTVGTERNVDIDIFRVELEKGDQVLMCSDGLWGEVEDDDIEAILNHYNDTRTTCRDLIRAAHHGGGKDNVTVMIVQVD